MMVASCCCYCIKFAEHVVVLDSSSSSSPCIAVAAVVVLKNVDDWRTRDCAENQDPILLDIDSDKRLSLLSMTMSLLPVVVVAAVDNNTHSNHLHCF